MLQAALARPIAARLPRLAQIIRLAVTGQAVVEVYLILVRRHICKGQRGDRIGQEIGRVGRSRFRRLIALRRLLRANRGWLWLANRRDQAHAVDLQDADGDHHNSDHDLNEPLAGGIRDELDASTSLVPFRPFAVSSLSYE